MRSPYQSLAARINPGPLLFPEGASDPHRRTEAAPVEPSQLFAGPLYRTMYKLAAVECLTVVQKVKFYSSQKCHFSTFRQFWQKNTHFSSFRVVHAKANVSTLGKIKQENRFSTNYKFHFSTFRIVCAQNVAVVSGPPAARV